MSQDFISFCRPTIGEDEINEVVECLKSGWLTTAKRTKQFEADFAEYVGCRHALGLNSCTAALHLALEAIDLKENELVLVPTYTFAATAEVVRYFNAIPVLVDCKADDFCMDMEGAETILKKIRNGEWVKGVPEDHGPVRAIMPVHFAGQVADVVKCRELCDEFDLRMIEDCAHTCPAWYRDENKEWKMVGESADIACFSFYANKNITTGEGGMAVTDNPEWDERMRILSLHGISKDAWKRFSKSGSWAYEITAPGFKYNLTDIAAALGIHQLRKSEDFWKERQRVAKLYDAELADIPGIVKPAEKEDRKHSWHLYIIRVIEDQAGIHRNEFIEALKEKNIGSSVHYIPLHMHPYYRDRYDYEPEDFPVARELSEQVVTLPLYPLLTDDQVKYICDSVKEIVSSRS